MAASLVFPFTRYDLATLTASARVQAELGEAVELAFHPGLAARDPDRALAAALNPPQRIAAADGKRMIVFFDELQDVASPSRPFGEPDRLTKQMRAIFQRSPRHEQALERIKLTKHAQTLAMRIARDQRPTRGSSHPPRSARCARSSWPGSWTAPLAANGEWRMADSLLRHYLAHLPGR